MWGVVVPAPWPVAVAAMALGGLFMSLVNSPMQTLVLLRIPRELRPQTLAVSAVLICGAAPIGLLVSGWALAHFQTRSVIAAVLALQTAAVLAIVAGALAERSQLRAAPVDSPA
jgi:hypothetical protein